MPSKQTIALISGANTGIGLAIATQLCQNHGYHVIIGSRDAAAGNKVAAALVADGHSASSVQLDVCSDESISLAASYVESKFGVLDVLINNAGIFLDRIPGDEQSHQNLSTRDLFSRTFDTNMFGAACLTEAFMPLLRRAEVPRIVFVSSRVASLAEATDKLSAYYSADYKAYFSSKAALNMVALTYAKAFDGSDGMVNVVCPGLVQTNITKYSSSGSSTEVGARRIVELASASKGGPTATFSDHNGVIPW